MSDPRAGGAEQYTIVLVEDDDGDALLVEELLYDTDLPHSLIRCRSAAEARATLATTPVDCVLLDLHLPDASGVETVQALQPERVLLLPDGVEDHWSPDLADLVALA